MTIDRRVQLADLASWGEDDEGRVGLARARELVDSMCAEVASQALLRAATDWAADPDSVGDSDSDARNWLRDRAAVTPAPANDPGLDHLLEEVAVEVLRQDAAGRFICRWNTRAELIQDAADALRSVRAIDQAAGGEQP